MLNLWVGLRRCTVVVNANVAILHFIQCIRKDKWNLYKSFCKTPLSTYCLYTHWNKHVIDNITIDIIRVSPGTILAYFCQLHHYRQETLNNPLVADSWISKSVCNLTPTTSAVETTLSSSSGQPRTPWDWVNKYKQRMFSNLLSIWTFFQLWNWGTFAHY